MDVFARLVSYLDVALFGGLAFVCLRYWRRRRDAPARWAALTFGVLGATVLFGLLLRHTGEEPTGYQLPARIFFLLMLAYPYALFRFGAAFRPAQTRALERAAAVFTGGLAVVLFVIPAAKPGQRTLATDVFLDLFFVQWAGLSGIVGGWLWRAGGGLPTVARRRMRTLALGAGALALAMLPVAIPSKAGTEPAAVVLVVTRLLPVLAALFFFVGFVPPAWLRMLWRRPEQAELRNVELSLITADTPAQVATRVLPHVAALVGGRGALLLGADGGPVGAHGYVEEGNQIVVELAHGRRLIVEASPYAPVFGAEEISLLSGLGIFVDLVLERVELLHRERAASDALARTNAELETLVYGISHDLRSPLLTLTGYLDYLQADYGAVLGEEGGRYLARMATSTRYMDDLITDLLELSRVGRVQTEVGDVDLDVLVADLAAEMAHSRPALRVEQHDLPVVRMNPVRARQLFTNLFENAARHAGRADVTIRVTATSRPDVCVVDVADDGVGIPTEHAEKVFGIFERLHRPDVDAPGTGIGLALCRRIAETAGGDLTLVAPPAGVPSGACFRLTLPATAVTPRRGRGVADGMTADHSGPQPPGAVDGSAPSERGAQPIGPL